VVSTIVLPVTPGIEVVKVSIDKEYFEVIVERAPLVPVEDLDEEEVVLDAVPVTFGAIEEIADVNAASGEAVNVALPPGSATSQIVVPSSTYQVVKVVLSNESIVIVVTRIGVPVCPPT